MIMKDTAPILRPVLYHVGRFTHTRRGAHSSLFAREKTQYVYRFLILLEGEVTAILGSSRYTLCRGDLLYLVPGERYRLITEGELSLLQVSFDLVEGGIGERPRLCVFTSELHEELMSPLPSDPALSPLAFSGLFSHTSAARVFSSLLTRDSEDALYPFLSAAALHTVLVELLTVAYVPGGRCEPILAYLRENPEGDLSAAGLASRFSYHKNYISALVKERTGMSLGRYVRRIRISHACALMVQEGLSPKEAATRLGYYDYSHFYKAFLAEMGASPRAYLAGHSAGITGT